MPQENIGFDMSVAAADFKALRLRLKEAEKTTRNKVSAAIREAVKPLQDAVKDSAEKTLPHHGGLADRIAKNSNFSIRQTQSTVTFKMKNSYDLGKIDNGRLRHPVFFVGGRKKVWVFQEVNPGFWSRPEHEYVPVVRVAVQKVMDTIGKEIEGH